MLWNAKDGSVALDGARMDYARFGRGEKHLVILPGLSDALASVKGKALLLAPPYKLFFDQYTVWMFSRRDPLRRGVTIRDMAEDQAAALHALGIEKAAVMGVSQGGMVVQYLAAEHPELVDRLILAVTAPCVNEMIRGSVERWIGFAGQGDHKSLMIDTAEKSYSEEHLKKYRKIYPLLGGVGRPKSYERFLANAEAILAFDARGELSKIACPTLVLGGEEDRIVGAAASRELHEAITGSELHLFPGLGHAAYEEAKDFNERIYRFLEG
ncbi:MAG: alpha/beta hydrolase [Oscillospiraceae bacterium]|nr:alpha/beta hydrolase [Oscillospiraceae bacterium]